MLSGSKRDELIDQIFDALEPMRKPAAHRAWLQGLDDVALVERHSLITGLTCSPRLPVLMTARRQVRLEVTS